MLGGLQTCSIKLRVFSILRLSDLDLICPPSDGRASSLSTLLLKTFLNMSKIVDSCESGGEYRNRTDDLLHAMQAL